MNNAKYETQATKSRMLIHAFLIFNLLFCAAVAPAAAQVASGGQYSLAQTVIAGGGGQNSAGGQYSLDGTIGQAAAGYEMTGSTFAATSGFWNYTPDQPNAVSYEGDVQDRPNGDTFVDSDDIQEIRRFAVGLDAPFRNNEFQRADCSPRSTFGDGFIDSDDVEQARRYSVGLDAKKAANGPTGAPNQNQVVFSTETNQSNAPVSEEQAADDLKNAPTAGRAVRVVNQTSSAGQIVTVPINVDTTGDETGYTFSVAFDQTKLTATNVTIGNLGGNVVFNINNAAGTIGFSVTSFPGANGTIAAVNNATLVNVTFTVAANAAPGVTNITFTDTPAKRKVSGIDPNDPLPQPSFTGGTITITAPTAAAVVVGGRVKTIDGRGIKNVLVTITFPDGQTRTTVSGASGYYSFADIPAGATYVFSVSAKHYKFADTLQVRQIFDDTPDIDFTAHASNPKIIP